MFIPTKHSINKIIRLETRDFIKIQKILTWIGLKIKDAFFNGLTSFKSFLVFSGKKIYGPNRLALATICIQISLRKSIF